MSGMPPSSNHAPTTEAHERVHLMKSSGMDPALASGACDDVRFGAPAAAAGCTAADVAPVLPVRSPHTHTCPFKRSDLAEPTE